MRLPVPPFVPEADRLAELELLAMDDDAKRAPGELGHAYGRLN